MQELANMVRDFIQVEIDCPSMHTDGLMPILDLAVRMDTNRTTYRYYRKSMANVLVLVADSAMQICLVQEHYDTKLVCSNRFFVTDLVLLLCD